jgi:hypothetical protein
MMFWKKKEFANDVFQSQLTTDYANNKKHQQPDQQRTEKSIAVILKEEKSRKSMVSSFLL